MLSNNNIKNKRGGFLQIIIFIIVALLIMKFLGVTVSEVVDWFKSFFGSVFS
jgi:hypothetical protein